MNQLLKFVCVNHEATAYLSGLVDDAVAVHESVPRGHLDGSREHLEGGRFPGAVDAQKTEALAASDAQGQVVDGLRVAVRATQLPHHENVLRRQFFDGSRDDAAPLFGDVVVLQNLVMQMPREKYTDVIAC